jgi:hypothetical protein
MREPQGQAMTDTEILDCMDEQKLQVSFNNHAGLFIVQVHGQVIGSVGHGRTIREAVLYAKQNLTKEKS